MDISQAFRKTRGGWELAVLLTPKASRTEVRGVALDGEGRPYVKVYVTAVPEANKANKALLALLAESFSVSKTTLSLVSGLTNRRKVIRFQSLPPL